MTNQLAQEAVSVATENFQVNDESEVCILNIMDLHIAMGRDAKFLKLSRGDDYSGRLWVNPQAIRAFQEVMADFGYTKRAWDRDGFLYTRKGCPSITGAFDNAQTEVTIYVSRH